MKGRGVEGSLLDSAPYLVTNTSIKKIEAKAWLGSPQASAWNGYAELACKVWLLAGVSKLERERELRKEGRE